MSKRLRMLSSFLAAAALAVLTACGGGGGDQVAGVTTGGSGFGVGVVTGFGSVIIDGERYQDAGAVVETEIDPRQGAVAVAAVQLGQRLQVEYRTAGIADRLRIDPDVIGVVQTPVSGGQFSVAGQTVRLNPDSNAGPVTLLVGYTSPAQIQAGDIVEVHGIARASAGANAISAARIEKRSALPAGLLRVTGVVGNASANGFRIGNLNVTISGGTSIAPAGRTVANGQRVVVWGASLSTSPSLSLAADAIRIRDSLPSANNTPSQVSGLVGNLTATGFDLDGFRVDLTRNPMVVPASTALAEGQYVIVRGSFSASGALVASQVRIRRKSPSEPEVELSGSISGYTSDSSFIVRGVTVDATAVNSRPACPSPLRDGVNVRIEGGVQGNKVVAESLRCS